MKLYYLGDFTSPHVYILAEYFANLGYKVHAYSELEPKRKCNEIQYSWIVGNKKSFKSQIPLLIYRICRRLPHGISTKIRSIVFLHFFKRDFDNKSGALMHAHFASDYGYFAFRSRFSNFVVSVWGSDVLIFPKQSKLLKRMLVNVFNCAKFVLASSRHVTALLLDDYNLNPGNVVDIQYGLERAKINLLRNTKKERKNEWIKVVNFRAAKPVYDNECYIEAARLCQKEKLPFEFTLISAGPLYKKYVNLSKKYSLHNIVIINGLPQDKLLLSLGEYDIFVSCSLSDGLSISLLEAMAASMFPIVSDIPANKNVIENRKNGLLFETSNPIALVNNLKYLLEKPQLWKDSLTKNFEWILSNQVLEENLALVEKKYKELIIDE